MGASPRTAFVGLGCRLPASDRAGGLLSHVQTVLGWDLGEDENLGSLAGQRQRRSWASLTLLKASLSPPVPSSSVGRGGAFCVAPSLIVCRLSGLGWKGVVAKALIPLADR